MKIESYNNQLHSAHVIKPPAVSPTFLSMCSSQLRTRSFGYPNLRTADEMGGRYNSKLSRLGTSFSRRSSSVVLQNVVIITDE